MRTGIRHLRLVDDRTARPALPTVAVHDDRGPVQWVLLDDGEQPVGVARSRTEVLDYARMMLDLGADFGVEPIGDRCAGCGAHPTDQHIENVCPKGA